MKKHKSILVIFLLALSLSLLNNYIFAVEDLGGNAKVYFICKPEDVTQEIYLFSDDQFLSLLKKSAYFSVNLKPGIHFIWSSDGNNVFSVNEFEFIPGQTYYINIGNNGYHSLLNPVNGIQLLQRVNPSAAINDKIKKSAFDLIEKYYVTMKIKPEKSITTSIKVFSSTQNDPTYIKVPKFTPIRLSFKEDISSKTNKTDDITWLQVSEDVVINNRVCISKGTSVKGVFWNVIPPKGYGMPGLIDIIIPEIQTPSNTSIPTVGRYIVTGISKAAQVDTRAKNSPSSGTIGGLVAVFVGTGIDAATKGKDAIINAGEEVVVWTREDSWVKPLNNQIVMNNYDQDTELESLKTQIPQDVIFPLISSPAEVNSGKAYELLFSLFSKYKIGNIISPSLYTEFKSVINKKLKQEEIPDLVCAKETHGYYLKANLSIGYHQFDGGTFELYEPDSMVLICKVEVKGVTAFSFDGSAKKIIQKGTEQLLDKLKKVKPSLIRE